ncbi:DUF732 domain-containing protein [[Mycobacterium] kokjensenii]|uniref:DUF732 domain-containing protein n=1 Tax=[Mycobacterium] kokjensenii TaxID=3064287 RepID=A0ABM9LWY1_9MYCO|nr:DUF732 domain-containing protein [Mycolicibacter sp. MU0083]CAJ1506108.1 DUF732 domain-containing protein [Mycolicibacter sp. MU0083]
MRTRRILSVVGVVAAIGCAAPASADPAPVDTVSADAAFLASLRAAGLNFDDDGQVIAAGHAVCNLIDNGETGLHVVRRAKTDNPGLTMDGAAQFTALAANAYCPHQLTK